MLKFRHPEVCATGIKEGRRELLFGSSVGVNEERRTAVPLVAYIDIGCDPASPGEHEIGFKAVGTGTQKIAFVSGGETHFAADGNTCIVPPFFCVVFQIYGNIAESIRG